MASEPPFASQGVAAVFEDAPDLRALRTMIFDVAAELDAVGTVEESLKWGQPSYASKVGTPLRLGVPKGGGVAIYAHCQSSVIPDFAALFGAEFEIEGTRAVHLDPARIAAQAGPLRRLIASALTYKL